MKKFYVELTAGFFVLAGILCLGYLSIRFGGFEIFKKEGYEVEAKFSEIGGLRTGAPVVIAGVDVGRVSEIALENYAAEVRLWVRGDIDLPEDTIASVKTRGLIGERFIALSPGGALKNIPPGGQIRETQSAVDLESLISKYAFGEVEK
ncbi:MAG: outer membrane lipid asymmetry maintenance protein MlaD [Planctomycetes bacterium]|nr:outer membrane lipid asymmetry maintenance protein MlaD [Planctomycetota bacterium]